MDTEIMQEFITLLVWSVLIGVFLSAILPVFKGRRNSHN